MSAMFLGALMLGNTVLLPTALPKSPCPTVFKYERMKKQSVWVGRVSVPAPLNGEPLNLSIHLQLQTTLPSKYVGLVELIEEQDATNKQSIIYRVRFPLIKPLPTVKIILVNNQIICVNNEVNGQIVTNIHLKHSLIPISTTQKSNAIMVQVIRKEEDTESDQLLDQYKECGQSITPNWLTAGTKIINRGDWPWLAAIFINNDLGLQFHCSGSIISDKLILTAGHCIQNDKVGHLNTSSIVVYLGKFNLRNWTESWSLLKEVSAVHLHPEFDSVRYNADLALLELSDSIEFTPYIKPVCLWDRKESINHLIGYKGTVVGWGQDEFGNKMTSEPRSIQLPVVSFEDCIENYKDFYHFMSSRRFCAGFKDGRGPCNGDSGGGLYLPVSKNGQTKWHLRGIVSLSLLNKTTNSCALTKYIVFTDVVSFRFWIIQKIQKYL